MYRCYNLNNFAGCVSSLSGVKNVFWLKVVCFAVVSGNYSELPGNTLLQTKS